MVFRYSVRFTARLVGSGLVMMAVVAVALGVMSDAQAAPPAQMLLSFDDDAPTRGRLDAGTSEALYEFECVEGGIGSVIVTTTSGDLEIRLDVLNAVLQTIGRGATVSESPFVAVAEAFEMPADGLCVVRLRRVGGTSGTYDVRLLPGFAQLHKWDTFSGMVDDLHMTWEPYASNNMTVTMRNEQLRLEVLTDNLLAYAMPSGDDVVWSDSYIQADFTIDGSPSYFEYGFVLRAGDEAETFYSVTFSSDGDYSVYYFDGEWNAVQDWTISGVVDGADQNPRVAVMAVGNVFRLFFNGRVVADVTDPLKRASKGISGVVAATAADQLDPLTVYIDNVVITVPHPRSVLPFGGQEAAEPTPTPPGVIGALEGATKEPQVTPTTAPLFPTETPLPVSRYPLRLQNWSSERPADVVGELQQSGVVPAGGAVALTVPSSFGDTSSAGFNYYRLGQGRTFGNFVLAFDARLVYSGAGAGCGMYYRNDGTASNSAMVFEDGWALLAEWDAAGKLMDTSVLDQFDAVITGTGAINRVVVVAVDQNLAMYVNGVLVAESVFTPRVGGLALEMFVPSDDADVTAPTYCQLNNIWLWEF